MIDLYSVSARDGWKASVTLEELELPYDVKAFDLSNSGQKQAGFLKIDPSGRIPAIIDREDGRDRRAPGGGTVPAQPDMLREPTEEEARRLIEKIQKMVQR